MCTILLNSKVFFAPLFHRKPRSPFRGGGGGEINSFYHFGNQMSLYFGLKSFISWLLYFHIIYVMFKLVLVAVVPFEESDNITVLILSLLRGNFRTEKAEHGTRVPTSPHPCPKQTSPINHSSLYSR